MADLQADFRKLDKDVRRDLNRSLRQAAEPMSRTAAQTASKWGAPTALGIRAGARGGKALIRQRRGRTTGNHPEFGSLQMREALLPAVEDGRPRLESDIRALLARNVRSV